jgi:hypothetical protein
MTRPRTAKILLAATAVLGVAAAALVAYAQLRYRSAVAERGNLLRASLANHRDALLEDHRALASLPLLAPRPGERDAGPVIGPRVRWRSAAAPAPAGAARGPALTLDPEVAASLATGWLHAGPEVWGRLLAAASGCRLASVRRRWTLPDEDRTPGWLDRAVARRRAEALLSVTEDDWLGAYEKAAP